MGAVYRAVDVESGGEVALKQSRSPHHDQRFEVEARLLSSLRHPRVVRIIDHFSSSSGQYVVMELVRGIELGVLLKERGRPGLPVEQAVEYVRQACEALQYIHDQQIVHRDVKPQNLILGEDGVVLVDFGIARALDESESPGTVGIGTPTLHGAGGVRRGRVSPRTDVFGVTATLWNLIAGRPPVYAEPTRLSTINGDVTPELEHTIGTGLEMIPERRVVSVAAFAMALGAPLRTETRSLAGGHDRQSGRPPQPDRGDRAHRRGGVRGGRLVDLPDRRDHWRAGVPVSLGRWRGRDRRRQAPPGRRYRRRCGGEWSR